MMKKILLTGNTCFAIVNFRMGLLRELMNEGYEIHVLAPLDERVSDLHDLEVTYHEMQMTRRGKNIVSEAMVVWRTFCLIKNIQPDIVFSYTIKNNIYSGLICRLLNIPFIPNITGLGPSYDLTGIVAVIIDLMYKISLKSAKRVFFQNSSDLDEFIRRGYVKAENTQQLLGSGVNLTRFPYNPEKNDTDSITFLMISRMLREKGVEFFVEAAKEIKREFPDSKFILVGPIDEGNPSSIPRAKLDKWSEEGIVSYEGEHKDVSSFLQVANCFVLPSWYREGTPRVLLEAAASGCVIVTTDTPGCRDTLLNEVTGFLCRPKDRGSLTDQMKRMCYLSKEERIVMANAANKLAVEKFDEANVISEYMQLVSDL